MGEVTQKGNKVKKKIEGWSNCTVGGAFALNAADPDLLSGIPCVPICLPAVISELKTRSNL